MTKSYTYQMVAAWAMAPASETTAIEVRLMLNSWLRYRTI